MKLLSLEIENYKNLKDRSKVNFDFTNCVNYVALIGLNGSGKSNIIEAISLIFSSLYHDKKLDFHYKITYFIREVTVRIEDGKMETIGKVVTDILKKDHADFLPTNIIASYSGEEMRMWENIYQDSYSDFFQDLKKNQSLSPKLLYVNKFSWEFALIALLSSENPVVKSFIKDVLQIGEDVEVTFTLDGRNFGTYDDNEAISLINRFIEHQNHSGEPSIPIQTIASLDLKARNNLDFTRKLFYYLFITGMPVKGDKIKAEKIIRKTDIKFNGNNVKNLSEGEKKLILIYTIAYLLADDKSLILLDEPDAHIHIERKKDIIDIINQDGHFTVFTTHSPKILNSIDEKNIRLIRSSDDIGVEILALDKLNALKELTNGEFSILDATLVLSTTKDILLVEGELDLTYLKEAIVRLNKLQGNKYLDFNFVIINCGGAGNVAAIFREIVAPNLKDNQFCLATFDDDKAGKDGMAGIVKYLESKPMPNVETMFHTHLAGWEANKEFFMEDYFPLEVYKTILLENINLKTRIKDFQQLSKDTVKTIINSNYKNFGDDDYINFSLILDEIVERQTAFHAQFKS